MLMVWFTGNNFLNFLFGHRMLFLLAIICFILAVAIGAWRQMCSVYALHMPFNCPRIWGNIFFRVGTWFLSTILSIVFALILAMWIMSEVHELFGAFTFGIFLYSRFLISGFWGAYPAIKRCDEFKNKYG